MDITLSLVALVFGGLLGAAFAHELTHAAVARAVGARVRIDWLSLTVTYEIPRSYPFVVDRVINLAPQLVGLAVAAGYLALEGLPPRTLMGGIGVAIWGVYTLLGGVEDYSLVVAHGNEWWWSRRSHTEQALLIATASVALGEALLFGVAEAMPTIVTSNVVGYLGVFVLLFGISEVGRVAGGVPDPS